MSDTQLATPPANSEATSPAPLPEPDSSSQPEPLAEPGAVSGNGPEAQLPPPEAADATEPTDAQAAPEELPEVVNQHDQAVSGEDTDDAQAETVLPTDTEATTDDNAGADDDSAADQPVAGETALSAVGEAAPAEAAAISVVADDQLDNAPDAQMPAPEKVDSEEQTDVRQAPEAPAETIDQHDQPVSIEDTDEDQTEMPPHAADAAVITDAAGDGDGSDAGQPVDGETALASVSEEGPVAADAIPLAAEAPGAPVDNGVMDSGLPDLGVAQTEKDELGVTETKETPDMPLENMDEAVPETPEPDNSPLQTGHDTEDGLPSVPENPVPSLPDDLPQHQTTTAENASQPQSEAITAIAADIADQMNKLEHISLVLHTMEKRFAEQSKSIAALSQELQKVSEETEQTVNWTEAVAITSSLSRWFLVVSIVTLTALLGGMGYLAVNQYQLMRQQSNASQAAATATELQVKRMAEFDKRFAELVGGAIKSERESISKESVENKINKLRGGASEQRILRKSTGDWLLPTGKGEELIADHDVIETLNQAFEKSGRPLITPRSIPPHKVVCFLKPNGKGGTELLVTRETTP